MSAACRKRYSLMVQSGAIRYIARPTQRFVECGARDIFAPIHLRERSRSPPGSRRMRAKREHYAARDHQKSARLTFIDEELFWTGEITRRSIEETFGVSEETAKLDLRDYRRGYASDLKPDSRDNIYRVPIDFIPRLSDPDPEGYLDGLARR